MNKPSPITQKTSLLEEEIEMERESSWCRIFSVFSRIIMFGGIICAVVLFSHPKVLSPRVLFSPRRRLHTKTSETLPDRLVEVLVPCPERVMLTCMSAEKIGDNLFFDAADEKTFECLQKVSLEEACGRFLKEIERSEDTFYDAVRESFATPNNNGSDKKETKEDSNGSDKEETEEDSNGLEKKETEEDRKQRTQEVKKQIGKFFRGVLQYTKEYKKTQFCVDCSVGQLSKFVFRTFFLPNLTFAGLFTDEISIRTLEAQFIGLSVKHEDRWNLKVHLKELSKNFVSTAIVLWYLPTLLVLFPGFTTGITIPIYGKAVFLNSTELLFPVLVGQMMKVPEKIWTFVRRSPKVQPSLEVFKKETKMFSPEDPDH